MSDIRTKEEKMADEAMYQIWREWISFHQKHFRADNLSISYADQMAFYEIAQPLLRKLSNSTLRRGHDL